MKKTVVIVGTGPGLGNHIAEKFGSMDFRVILLARHEAVLKQYQKELTSQGIEAFCYAADASDFNSLKAALEKIFEQFGMIDALIYNVGITTLDAETHIDADTLIERYRTDVAGAYRCVQLLDQEAFAQKGGVILVTGGKLATQPHFEYLPLSMDKAALRAMVYAMLSSDELITLAETENHSNVNRIHNIISGIIDVLAVALIVLPIYGEPQGNYFYHVNLLSIARLSNIDIGIHWAIYLLIIGLGIARLAFISFDKERLCSIISKVSVAIGAVAICLFAAAREPYVTILLFLFFAAKIFLLLQQSRTK